MLVASPKRLRQLWPCGELRAVQDRIHPLAALEFERISDEAGHNFDEHPIHDGWIILMVESLMVESPINDG